MTDDNPILTSSLNELVNQYGYSKVENQLVKLMGQSDLNLSKIGSDVLKVLYLLDFMTMDHLRATVFPGISHSGCCYHLNKLMSGGLILKGSYYIEGENRIVLWGLTKLGLKMVTKMNGDYGAVALPHIRKAKEDELNHDLCVNQIFADIATTCGGYKNLISKIDWYPFEKRQLKLNEEGKYDPKRGKEYLYSDIIYPDAIIDTAREDIKIFIEYETGTRSKADVTRSLRRYAEYFQKTKEHCSRPVILLYTTPDEDKKIWIQKEAEEIGGSSGLANFKALLYGNELIEKLTFLILGGPDGKGG